MKRNNICALFSALCLTAAAQNKQFNEVIVSINPETAELMYDNKKSTGWQLSSYNLREEQNALFKLKRAGDLCEINMDISGIDKSLIEKAFTFHCTYDPMNPGPALKYEVFKKGGITKFTFPARYGAYLKMIIKGNAITKDIKINEISVDYINNNIESMNPKAKEMPWYNSSLSIEERIESALAAMTTEEKMNLIREGWGLPGVPRLGIPNLTKVEAIHGAGHKGATIFPQIIGMSATWNRNLIREVGSAIGKEMVDAHYLFAWSPVLDVAQDPRWGRCEETFGEDPVLVSELSGKWIEGLQSEGPFATPKHFGGHGSTMGGRDSHDVGLSEREMREVHLVPFRNAFKNIKCQSTMMAYSDYMGVPVAKSHELLVNILREEWGFDGFIVSDCGAIGNLTGRKHYTAKDKIEAAQQSLAVGIATNCGDVYNDPDVIKAAVEGKINMKDLDNTCRDVLRVIIRNGLLENNPCAASDEEKNDNPTFNSPEHKKIALKVAQESMTLLKNSNSILPLSKDIRNIAVIGPGASQTQTGDYSAQALPGQISTILDGIKNTVGKKTNVIYEKGCDFTGEDYVDIPKAVEVAKKADVAIVTLGDYSNDYPNRKHRKTSGENEDYASLMLSGKQEELLKAVCETGTPVVVVYQIGRPYNLTYATEHADAILVAWLPGQEGGDATADVLFGEYNPAGRLSMTFPRSAAQLPLIYNFKTSGRGYGYVDMPFYPLYRFGFGLSYTEFKYSDMNVVEKDNGNVYLSAKVTNIGKLSGDEVVQLYVTDMYASVKTRVMELKDFKRISLKPGETKEVSFELTPYQISLLNDKMSRVVEAGEFRFFIGGVSPEYDAGDFIKNTVNYKNEKEGVSGKIDYSRSFAAKFILCNPKRNTDGSVSVTVENKGNLTDIGKIEIFVDSEKKGYAKHFELDPDCKKEIVFENIPLSSQVMFVSEETCLKLN